MQNPNAILKKYWGYEQFRPLQKEIIDSLLLGKDTLAILPTGGGKSICFQLPCLLQEGICIVVSPLVALMKDQVFNLKKRGIPALSIHSGMERQDVIRTLKNASGNYFKFLYVSPERLETALFKEYLPSLQVNMIAVDEAHCISQWGYDFRPSYLKIADLRKELPDVPVIALTASATPLVQNDICEQLQLKTANIYKQSFARKNLSYSAFHIESKLNKLLDIIKKVKGAGIIYCKSRKRTAEIASFLKMHGIAANNYHAGLTTTERSQRQADWVDNKTGIIVCTNAFGMGIDKPDVRKVIHFDVPDCLENYYQEAGRAGRDGEKAYAVLLSSEKDVAELSASDEVRFPPVKKVRHVYQSLVNYLQIPVNHGENTRYIFRFNDFIDNFKLKAIETLNALKALEQDGWLEWNEKNYTPSSIVFTTNKNELYQFEKLHPEFEGLLTTLLRTYEGIFDFPSFVSERMLAKILGREEQAIIQELKTIAGYGVIRYMQRNDAPFIVFKKNRVKTGDLLFNIQLYKQRKKSFSSRIEKMLLYTATGECRSRFISNYFGDKDANRCGVCDNCLRSKKMTVSSDEFSYLSRKIASIIQSRDITFPELLTEMDSVNKEKLWKVISFLQAEEKITATENGCLKLSRSGIL